MKRLVRVRRSDPAPVGYPLELWQQTLGFEDSDLTALYPGATALTASEVCAKWGGLPLTLFDIYWPSSTNRASYASTSTTHWSIYFSWR